MEEFRMFGILFLIAILFVLPMIVGMLFNQCCGDSSETKTMIYLKGVIFLFLLFEIIFIIGIKAELSFTVVLNIALGCCFVMTMLSMMICKKEISTTISQYQQLNRKSLGTILVGVLFLLLCGSYFLYEPFFSKDMVEETVRTILSTNTIYQYNPATGLLMENGMYPITKLNTVPVFYAILQQTTGLPLEFLLYNVIPMWILFLNVLITSLFGKKIFQKSGTKTIFLCFYLLLLMFGVFQEGSFGFRILHTTYTGNTILLTVLIPFFFFQLLEYGKNRNLRNLLGTLILIMFNVLMFIEIKTANFFFITQRINTFKEDLVYYVIFMLMFVLVQEKSPIIKKQIKVIGIALFLSFLFDFKLLFLSYFFTKLSEMIGDREQNRKIALVSFTFIIIMSGSVMPLGGAAVEKSKLNNSAEEQVIEYIDSIALKLERPVMIVGTNNIMEQARKKSTNIIMPYGKDYWISNVNKEIGDIYSYEAYQLYADMIAGETKQKEIFQKAMDLGCEIVILNWKVPNEKTLQWELVEQLEQYYIYSIIFKY